VFPSLQTAIRRPAIKQYHATYLPNNYTIDSIYGKVLTFSKCNSMLYWKKDLHEFVDFFRI